MNELSIAFIVSNFPSIIQTYIISAISGLMKNNCSVTVIASKMPDQSINKELLVNSKYIPSVNYINPEFPDIVKEIFSVPFYSIKYWLIIFRLAKSNIYRNFGMKYSLRTIILAKIIYHHNFDILHSHNLTLSYYYIALKELLSIPLITTFHGKEPQHSSSLNLDKQRIVFNHGDLFLVNTKFAQKSLVELGCPLDKIRIIPQGTSLSSFPFNKKAISENSPIHILTVGRLSAEKGHEIAINAISTLTREFPNLKYHIVGGGPEKNRLETIRNHLGLQSTVTFHGLLSTEELNKLYLKAHIFVLPSIDLHDGLHVETQGVVLQEAQASGIAVIASRTGGIPDVIENHKTGLLFNEGSESDLANNIRNLIKNPEIYEEICQGGRNAVETVFDINIISKQVIDIYKDTISTKFS